MVSVKDVADIVGMSIGTVRYLGRVNVVKPQRVENRMCYDYFDLVALSVVKTLKANHYPSPVIRGMVRGVYTILPYIDSSVPSTFVFDGERILVGGIDVDYARGLPMFSTSLLEERIHCYNATAKHKILKAPPQNSGDGGTLYPERCSESSKFVLQANSVLG